jgi:hypothetical protein
MCDLTDTGGHSRSIENRPRVGVIPVDQVRRNRAGGSSIPPSSTIRFSVMRSLAPTSRPNASGRGFCAPKCADVRRRGWSAVPPVAPHTRRRLISAADRRSAGWLRHDTGYLIAPRASIVVRVVAVTPVTIWDRKEASRCGAAPRLSVVMTKRRDRASRCS